MYFEFHHERRQAWAPAVDVCERTAEIVIFVEMPGMERGDVKLAWHNGVLSISGFKRPCSDSQTSRYHCVERAYGHFRREIAINIPIAHDEARAEIRDGLMRIYLPKITSKPETVEIPIND